MSTMRARVSICTRENSSSFDLDFFFQCSATPRDLHSFPTRRSSDLSMVMSEAEKRMTAYHEAGHAIVGMTVPEHDNCVSDRKSTRLNSSHSQISYAVFCLKKKKKKDDSYRILVKEKEKTDFLFSFHV